MSKRPLEDAEEPEAQVLRISDQCVLVRGVVHCPVLADSYLDYRSRLSELPLDVVRFMIDPMCRFRPGVVSRDGNISCRRMTFIDDHGQLALDDLTVQWPAHPGAIIGVPGFIYTAEHERYLLAITRDNLLLINMVNRQQAHVLQTLDGIQYSLLYSFSTAFQQDRPTSPVVAIAVTLDNRVALLRRFAADRYKSMVSLYTVEGTLLSHLDALIDDPNPWTECVALHVSQRNELVLLDAERNQLGVMTMTGEFVRTVPLPTRPMIHMMLAHNTDDKFAMLFQVYVPRAQTQSITVSTDDYTMSEPRKFEADLFKVNDDHGYARMVCDGADNVVIQSPLGRLSLHDRDGTLLCIMAEAPLPVRTSRSEHEYSRLYDSSLAINHEGHVLRVNPNPRNSGPVLEVFGPWPPSDD